eukprot:Sdes_comp18757_c0_seq1m9152
MEYILASSKPARVAFWSSFTLGVVFLGFYIKENAFNYPLYRLNTKTSLQRKNTLLDDLQATLPPPPHPSKINEFEDYLLERNHIMVRSSNMSQTEKAVNLKYGMILWKDLRESVKKHLDMSQEENE